VAQFPADVPRVIATLAKSPMGAHPEMQCFFATPEDWQRDTTFREAPLRLESEYSDA